MWESDTNRRELRATKTYLEDTKIWLGFDVFSFLVKTKSLWAGIGTPDPPNFGFERKDPGIRRLYGIQDDPQNLSKKY